MVCIRYLPLCIVLSGCSFSGPGDDVTDAGSEAVADTPDDTADDSAADTVVDTGTDTGCEECPVGQTCLSWVRGRVLYEDGTPVTGIISIVKFHIALCYYTETDEEGYFEIFKGCYNVDERFYMEVPSIPAMDDTRTRIVVEYNPTREQISDDFVFDVGTIYWWSKPEATHGYTAGAGASVDEAGVQFDVAPGALGDEPLMLGVFDFPLDRWVPPFIANPYSEGTVDHVDALYLLSPYWQQVVGDGLVLRIDPPEGWAETDTGKLYMLGDWVWYFVELPGVGEMPIGQVVEVGPVTYEGGKLVTPPIPVLGWVMMVKD